MKKILFVIGNLAGGGAEKSLINLLKNLPPHKYEIDLFLFSFEGLYLKEVPKNVNISYMIDLNKSKFHLLIEKIKYRILTLYMSKINCKIIYKKYIKKKYDIEISFLEGLPTKFVGDSSNNKSKKIAWVHTDLSTNHWYANIYYNLKQEENYYHKFKKIIFVSNDASKGFNTLFKNNFNSDVVYNILDKNEITNKSNEIILNFSEFTICCVGNLKKIKGFDRLINVHAKLISEGFNHKLLILGEGPERYYLEKRIKELKVLDSVELKGYVENPYPYMKNSDVIICCSYSEGFSLTVAEALILNKAIISTKCSGPIEILDNGEYGILVENNEQGLYDGLKLALTNKKIIGYFEKKANERISYFDTKNIIKKIDIILN